MNREIIEDVSGNISLDISAILYVEFNGKLDKHEVKKIWGYAENGKVYINKRGFRNQFNFHPIQELGTLSYFLGTTTRISIEDAVFGGANQAVQPDLTPFILDMRTGEVVKIGYKEFVLILKDDDELYYQYMNLNKELRKNSIYKFIKKYNLRNPFFIEQAIEPSDSKDSSIEYYLQY